LVGRIAAAFLDEERNRDGASLWREQRRKHAVQVRLQEIRERRERELYLRAGRAAREDEIAGLRRVLQGGSPQGGLAGSRGSLEDEAAREAGAVVEVRVERVQLRFTTDKLDFGATHVPIMLA
jgi:hypothetical protein